MPQEGGIMIRTLAAALATTTCLVAIASPAAAQTREFNIPAGSLRAALDAFARQAGRQVIYRGDQVRSAQSPGVRGAHTADEALDAILAGTGFKAQKDSSGAFAVAKVGNAPAAAQTASTSRESESYDNSEIVVTGTNIKGGAITKETVVLNREYIRSTGLSTTTRLIESLPQNFALASQSGVNTPGVSDNSSHGSAINLRGVGEGTTLVLLNGRRLPLGFTGSAVDISAIPLSAVDRVEVVLDGASAIYGSDAIGGVVNFILRRDYKGLESQARFGLAPGGMKEYRLSQTAGTAWSTGGVIASFEYYHRDRLDASERDFVPAGVAFGSLLPRENNYSLTVSGHQDVFPNVELFADGLYTHRNSETLNQIAYNETGNLKNPQASITGGARWRPGSSWNIELSGSFGSNLNNIRETSDLNGAAGDTLRKSNYKISTVDLKGDGQLAELPGGPIRLALGASWRHESLDYSVASEMGPTAVAGSANQNVTSLYGELLFPLVGTRDKEKGIQHLDLSIAGRYDRYSNFGSAFNPSVGLLFEAIPGVKLRGNYGRAYRAPKLSDYNLSATQGFAYFDFDPGTGGTSKYLYIIGSDAASLRPQTSNNYSLGIDVTPHSVPGLKVSATYYSIKYKNQIATPPDLFTIVANPQAYGRFLVRNPSLAQIQDYLAVVQGAGGLQAFDENFNPDPSFNPASIQVIVDQRRRNISVSQTSGLDMSLSYAGKLRNGTYNLGLNATYVFDLRQQITPQSESVDVVGTVFNPPRFRLRASAAATLGRFSGSLFGNFVGGYSDVRVTPADPISSYLTFDGRVARTFGKDSKLEVSVNAQNIFNRRPPSVPGLGTFGSLGFDPTNASPLGRLVALEIVKRW